MIRVMLTDDNCDMIRLMNAYLSHKPDVEIIACARNGNEAKNVLGNCIPDILLLDLHMPVVDGFDVINYWQHTPSLHAMRVIVVTGTMRDSLIRQAMAMGATYFLLKPFVPELLYERIKYVAAQQAAMPSKRAEMEKNGRASELLRAQGIAENCKGFAYLRMALDTKRAGSDLLMTKHLYPAIGRRFGVSSDSVERAIRSAIDAAWNRGGLRASSLFQNGMRPSNSNFINRLAEELD